MKWFEAFAVIGKGDGMNETGEFDIMIFKIFSQTIDASRFFNIADQHGAVGEKFLRSVFIFFILNGKNHLRPVIDQAFGHKKRNALFIGHTGHQKCFS